MLDFFRNLIPDGIRRAAVAKVAQWAGAHVAGAALLWIGSILVNHHWALTGAVGSALNEFCGAVGALVVSGVTLGYALWDTKVVDTKIKVAANAGYDAGIQNAQVQGEQAQASADQEKADATSKAIAAADAASPKTDADIDRRLTEHSI